MSTQGRRLERLASVGVLPSDSEDERIQKSTLTVAAIVITALATVWVTTYFVLGLTISALIPLAYQIASITSLVHFAATKRYRIFRLSQLLLMLVLPFLLHVSLGGFVASSGVILWSFTAPLGGLLFYGTRRAVPWFGGFLAVLVGAGILEAGLSRQPAAIPFAVQVSFFVMNLAGVSLTVFVLLQFFVGEREKARAALAEEHRLLVVEQGKSERLLLNVLPQVIAERLKADEQIIADAFDEATVMFADIVGFTPLAERIPPNELVAMLNRVFSAFDRIADANGLEKIKTVGDSYMAVGGIPTPRPNHADAVADAALAMQQEIRSIARATGLPLDLRIGIDTGPVVAGVIGKRKFAYDLWGDIVNTASRMESHGVAGQIHLTERTYRRLKNKYQFRERKPIPIKGKGEMRTYLLVATPEVSSGPDRGSTASNSGG